jgi:hypothetical protein
LLKELNRGICQPGMMKQLGKVRGADSELKQEYFLPAPPPEDFHELLTQLFRVGAAIYQIGKSRVKY